MFSKIKLRVYNFHYSGILTVMKKYFSKMVGSSLIIAVAFATVFCCHPSSVASAASTTNTAETKSSHDFKLAKKVILVCHHCKPSTSNKTDKTCCTKQFQAVVPNPISLNANILQLSVIRHLDQPAYFFHSKFNLAYLYGPPGQTSQIPLYILTHHFRI